MRSLFSGVLDMKLCIPIFGLTFVSLASTASRQKIAEGYQVWLSFPGW